MRHLHDLCCIVVMGVPKILAERFTFDCSFILFSLDGFILIVLVGRSVIRQKRLGLLM
jgi:hypothetical protein